MAIVEIEVLDTIESRIETKNILHLDEVMEYRLVAYTQGQYSRHRKMYEKNAYLYVSKDLKWHYFHTGLIDRITTALQNKGIEVDIKYKIQPKIQKTTKPFLKGINLRQDQIKLINECRRFPYRGVIISPTGSGKTVMQGAIISSFPENMNILWLAHTIPLITQTHDEFKKWGIESQIIGGKYGRTSICKRIVISTMQSFVKYLEEDKDLAFYFDMIIVDEAHHLSKITGTYGKILSELMAPMRFGFTATPPKSPEAIFALEGLVGPIIGELTINQATELNLLAKPKIKIIDLPLNYRVKDLNKYADVYTAGIVFNDTRNKRIIDTAITYIKEKKSVLILVSQIEHGKELQHFAKAKGYDIPFVQGSTENNTREKVKKQLIGKNIHAAICTVVWKEGVNIPSLDIFINASGGKGEIPVLQGIGRGLRKTDKKEEVLIVDFFDPSHKYLIEHFGNRISLYCRNNWL